MIFFGKKLILEKSRQQQKQSKTLNLSNNSDKKLLETSVFENTVANDF